ncbi:uncharacterized protein LOC142341298 [Convolutriloba macropyga]|uniref:uncharacterized protein LOC142341298 n=1 Tax=Convolutriloba macropyga TaxID=536237 RepID=UPI003F528807
MPKAVSNFDCQNNPYDSPSSTRKWYMRTAGGANEDTYTCEQYFSDYPNAQDGPTDKLRLRGFKMKEHSCYREHGQQMSLKYTTMARAVARHPWRAGNLTSWGDVAEVWISDCLAVMPQNWNSLWYHEPGSMHGSGNRIIGKGASCSVETARNGGHYLNLEGTGFRLSNEVEFTCSYVPGIQFIRRDTYTSDVACTGQCVIFGLRHKQELASLGKNIPILFEIF